MNALDRLSLRMGIEPEFRDAIGQVRRTDADVSRGLLTAMGLTVTDAREAEAAIRELERADAGRPLPPVMVVRQTGVPLAVPITLPVGTGAIQWSVADEKGGQRMGTASFAALAPVSSNKPGSVDCRQLDIPVPETIGHYRLRLQGDGFDAAEMALIVVPERCHVPEGLAGDNPVWGISLQLYLLRSTSNWGIGDFTDLKQIVRVAADLGASTVGLNPLHAMFLDAPEHASPYSPASRLFLNILCIDVTAVPEYDNDIVRSLVAAPNFQVELAACRNASLVQYAAVARLKLPVLKALFDVFRREADRTRVNAFDAFRREQGDSLERVCRFQALREHFAEQAPQMADWRHWPKQYQDAGSPAVAGFAREHRNRIDFLAWAQWIADQQLAAAAAAARASGMTIGLYRDLAVGADSGGAETWARPDVVLSSAHVGAPPDVLNPAGQDWGLPPFDPRALRQEAYAGFIELIRANMRHAGGLRIDHVMALQHLYLIPEGWPPSDGAYVSYPLEDLIGVLCLESQRQRCLVVGEDLGTVPEGFRERLEAAAILSYRVVFFEVDNTGAFVGPERYPPLALATIGSHDLATLRGWWEERDIELKARHGLYPTEDEERRQREQRVNERSALVAALATAGLGARWGAASPFSPELAEAVHAYLARTRAGLAMVQLDDLTDEAEQVNLPATTDQHPNWRRKQSLRLEDIAANPRIRRIADTLNKARPASADRGRHNVF